MRNWFSDDDTGTRSDEEFPTVATEFDGRTRVSNVCEIEVDRITADDQTREHFDETALRELAENIRQHGQLQPIRVRWDATRSLYVIIAGERRWRACKLAGLATVQAIVVDGADEQKVLREQIIENCLREDLKPVEQGKAFQRLMDSEGWSASDLARNINVNPSTVSRALKLLQLPSEMQQQVDAGKITARAAIETLPKERKQPARKKPTREEKIRTGTATVTVKARKLLTDDALIAALTDALNTVRSRQEQSKAA